MSLGLSVRMGREEHAAETSIESDWAYSRNYPSPWPHWVSIGGRDGLPSGDDGTGEHLYERRHHGHDEE